MEAPPPIDRILVESEAAWRRLPSRYQVIGEAWTRADPHVVLHELRRVAGRRPRFLEWGSGIGTHCLIADALGMEAHGIEIDGPLAAAAGDLALKLGAGCVFAEGSFIPPGTELPEADEPESETFLFADGPDGHTELARSLSARGRSPRSATAEPICAAAAFDVIYAFPAPQHVDWFAALFRDVARVGAVFWCYTETAGILASTKTGAHAITPLRPA